jgi:multimeric flavodoxin WrbA
MPQVLISYQTFSGKTKILAEAVAEGVKTAGAEAVVKGVVDTTIQDMAAADAIVLATTQPFRTMAGETKSLFERLWKDKEQINPGKPIGFIVCHVADDATPTLEAMKGLAKLYGFVSAEDGVAVHAAKLDEGKERCRQLGAALAK